MLDEPPAMENPRLESLLGAVAEYLAQQYGLSDAPDWAYSPPRYLDQAWHVSSISCEGMREYLTFSSPHRIRIPQHFYQAAAVAACARAPAPGE